MTDHEQQHAEEQFEAPQTGDQANDHAGEAPEELRPVISALESGPLDEDRYADEEEDGEYIDAEELMNTLGRLQAMLEEQGKELRGLRREMRDLRESLARGSQGGERPAREGRESGREGGREGGYRGREGGGQGRGEGWTPYNRDRGEQRGGDRDSRPREGGFRPREGGSGGGYRGQGGSQGGGFRERSEGGFRPREGGSGNSGGDFRSREFRPREGGSGGGGTPSSGGGEGYRPRPRRDHGWGGKKRDE